MATRFAPRLGSSSSRHTKYECVKKLKTINWRSPRFRLKLLQSYALVMLQGECKRTAFAVDLGPNAKFKAFLM